MKLFGIDFNHKKLYLFGLILVAMSLPLSKFVLSVSILVLTGNWILEANFRQKLLQLWEKKAILIFLGVFGVHLLWLINTTDYTYAFHDLSKKVILIVFPIIIGTSKRLSERDIHKILTWFWIALLASTCISVLIYIGVIEKPINRIRDISPFMSYIRLSLLVNMGIFTCGYYLLNKSIVKSKVQLWFYGLSIGWFSFFLFILKSLTGILIFLFLAFILLSFLSFRIKDIVPRLFLQMGLLTVFLLIASFITHSISKYYSHDRLIVENLEKTTLSGNKYKHYVNDGRIENGHYVWIYVCEKELEKEWNQKSVIPYRGKDGAGQDLRVTLVRYLTSKNLKKDSVGVSKLTDYDIRNVEAGMANYMYADKFALYPYVYRIIWEIDTYIKGRNPAGNSITQRFEYLKTARNIIHNNFWFGVGTGDVQKAFQQQYETDKSSLPGKYRLRSHNQFVTFFVSFGLVGFIILFFSMFYPVFYKGEYKNFLLIILLFIALLSFLSEDTLETHVGVTFFSYFYSLFLFGKERLIKSNDDEKDK